MNINTLVVLFKNSFLCSIIRLIWNLKKMTGFWRFDGKNDENDDNMTEVNSKWPVLFFYKVFYPQYYVYYIGSFLTHILNH